MQPAVPLKRPRDTEGGSDTSSVSSGSSDTSSLSSGDNISSSSSVSSSSLSDNHHHSPEGGKKGGGEGDAFSTVSRGDTSDGDADDTAAGGAEPQEYKRNSGDALPSTLAGVHSVPRFFFDLEKLGNAEHKGLHYLKESIRLFLLEAKRDYDKQKMVAIGNKKEVGAFRWSNAGATAEQFAIACDQVKKIHQVLSTEHGGTIVKSHGQQARGGEEKGGTAAVKSINICSLKTFIANFISYLVSKSEVGGKTYEVKVKDWEKGGTRYDSSNSDGAVKGNVKFEGALRRQQKLDLWMKKNELLPVGSRVVSLATGKATSTTTGGSTRTAPTRGALNRTTTSPIPEAGNALNHVGAGGLAGSSTLAAITEQVRHDKEQQMRRRIQEIINDGQLVLKVSSPSGAESCKPDSQDWKNKVALGLVPQMDRFVNVCRQASLYGNTKSRQFLLDALERCVFRGVEMSPNVTSNLTAAAHFLFEKGGGMQEVAKWLEQCPEEGRHSFLLTLCKLKMNRFNEATKKRLAKSLDEDDQSSAADTAKDLTWLISGEGPTSTATLVRVLEGKLGLSSSQWTDMTVVERVEKLNKRAWATYSRQYTSTSPWACNRGVVPPYNPFDYLAVEDQLKEVLPTDTESVLFSTKPDGTKVPISFQYPPDSESPHNHVDQAWNPNRSDLLYVPPLLTTPIPVKQASTGGLGVPEGRYTTKPDAFSFDDWVNYLTEEHELKKAGKL